VYKTTQELSDMREHLRTSTPAERLEANTSLIEDLVASGIRSSALKVGDPVEDFVLPDARGKAVALHDLLSRGPVVISFYRGGWCPFCSIELRGLQRVLPQITGLGASLVAISPQVPDHSLSTEEENQLTFPVLSDVGNDVARRFGIVFKIPPGVVEANRLAGRDFVDINGQVGSAELPLPATFILDAAGSIRLAFLEEDWSKRLDPEIVVETLRSLETMRTNHLLGHVVDKSKLRETLLQLEAVSMEDAAGLYQSHLEGARLDLSDSDDQGQRSQQEQSGVEAKRFEEQSHLHERHRQVIESISFGPSSRVEPGALVKINERYFLIAVPTQRIHFEGIEILGISVESPLFEAMAGLKAGERFELNQKVFTVDDIQ
jgi:peroxiredoxin